VSPSLSRHRPARLGARALGGVAVAAALVLAGCGGDSDGGGASAPSTAASVPARTATTAGVLTHAQLVAKADAACAKASDAIGAIPVARSLSALAEYAAAARRVGQDLREQLGALKPGVDDQGAYATYLDGIDAANAALDAMRTAAQGGDAKAVRAAAATIDKTAVGVLATRAGLPGCAATAPGGAAS
jgi:hypothetical protein